MRTGAASAVGGARDVTMRIENDVTMTVAGLWSDTVTEDLQNIDMTDYGETADDRAV